MNKKLVLGAVCLLLFTIFIYTMYNEKTTPPPAAAPATGIATQTSLEKDSGLPVVGSLAPDFEIESLDNKALRLSDFRGKVVVLNFWATWCPECKNEMPALEKFYSLHKTNDLVVIAVNVMQRENVDRIKSYVATMGLTFPVGLDRSQSVGQKYGVHFLPTSYVIDRQGMIAAVKIGPLSEGELDSFWKKANEQ